ncbi:MAG: hypothetical protein ACKVOM_09880 [Ferruginibacter sp.]
MRSADTPPLVFTRCPSCVL